MADLEGAKRLVMSYKGPKIRIMEVCGTHTHEIFRLGIRKLLSPHMELVSGPGCPVCVTPVAFIDEALWLAQKRGVTVCTFGDLLRVPGSSETLSEARARGADVRVVHLMMPMSMRRRTRIRKSPFWLSALKRRHPGLVLP